MTKRLTGKNPLAYIGVEPLTPANTTQSKRNPTSNDFKGIEIGDIWVNTATDQVWLLASKADNNAIWVEIGTSSGVGASDFVTDVGTAVVDAFGVIQVKGGSLITTDALVANTVTISLDSGTDGQIIIGSTSGSSAYGDLTSTGGTITVTEGPNTLNIEANTTGFASSYPTDSGTALPVAGILNVIGDANLTTSGSGNTVSVGLLNGTDGQVLIGGGSDAEWANITSLGGTITVTNSANSINLESTDSGANDFVTDSGTATQAFNSLNVFGDSALISTEGAGDTVEIIHASGLNGQVVIGATSGSAAFATLTSSGGTVVFTPGPNTLNLEATGVGGGASTFNTDGAPATEALGAITMAGGTLITTSGAGSTVTFDLDSGTDGQLIIGSSIGVPAYANLTSMDGSVVITNGHNSINLAATGTGGGASSFPTDSGTAIEIGGDLNINGGSNINTSGLANTVIINLSNSPSVSGTITAGNGLTVSAGGIDSTGTTRLRSLSNGLLRANAGGFIGASNGTNGQLMIGGGTLPNWANLTSSDSSITITNGANSIDLKASGVGASKITVFNTSGTWTKSAGTNMVTVLGWHGGGGGASGSKGTALGNSGGGGGGAQGSVFYFTVPAIFCGAAETVTVGVGGTGGAAIATNNTQGDDGNPGTPSLFGKISMPQLASQGLADPSQNYAGGQAGFLYDSSNSLYTGGTNGPVGVAIAGATPNSTVTVARSGGTGGSIGNGSNGTNLGGVIIGQYIQYKTLLGTGGGGGGAVAFSGGKGGAVIGFDGSTVIYPGAVANANGANSPISGGLIFGGFGGGGGNGQIGATQAIKGGNGGFAGGGGGGGGACSNTGTASGAGGNGGNGIIIVIEW